MLRAEQPIVNFIQLPQLLLANGRFAPLPIAASRTVALGGTGGDGRFARHWFAGVRAQAGWGEIASLSGAGDNKSK